MVIEVWSYDTGCSPGEVPTEDEVRDPVSKNSLVPIALFVQEHTQLIKYTLLIVLLGMLVLVELTDDRPSCSVSLCFYQLVNSGLGQPIAKEPFD